MRWKNAANRERGRDERKGKEGRGQRGREREIERGRKTETERDRESRRMRATLRELEGEKREREASKGLRWKPRD